MVESCSLHSGGWGSGVVLGFGIFFLGLKVKSFINVLDCVFRFPNLHVVEEFFNIWGEVTAFLVVVLPHSFSSVEERCPEVTRETIVSHCPLTAEAYRAEGKLWPCTAYVVRDENQLYFFFACNIIAWGERSGIRISASNLQGCLQNKSNRRKCTQWCFPEQGDSPEAWNSTWQMRYSYKRVHSSQH